MGFDGKMVIHPSQINLSNTIFSPTEKEVLEAEVHNAIVNLSSDADGGTHVLMATEGAMVQIQSPNQHASDRKRW